MSGGRAVNRVNQWQYTLKVYAAEKEWYTWTVLLRLVFLDKGLWRRCFPVNFAKFLRTPLVPVSVKACNFTKIRLRHGCFYVNFLTNVQNVLLQNTPRTAVGRMVAWVAISLNGPNLVHKLFLIDLLSDGETTF